jgi:uncharacterized membrane protein
MKIFGHPLHVMLIHFPSALLPMDFICSLLAFYISSVHLVHTSFFAMTGGVVLGMLAIITGAFDLISVTKDKSNAVKKVLIHGGINGTMIIAYSVLAFMAYKKYPDLAADSIAILITKAGLITFMIVGNYLGGNLVLKEKIGVEK